MEETRRERTLAGGDGAVLRAASSPSSGSKRCSTLTDFAAIDLGASSGRVVCGHFDGGVIALEECHRFSNRPVRLPDGLRWNLLHLFTEAVGALRRPPLRRCRRRHLGRGLRAAGRAPPRARSPLPLPRRAHRRCRSGWRATRSPASSTCRSTPSTSCWRTIASATRPDRAGPGPARVLALRRARQRAHERLHHGAAGRAHRRVVAGADRARSGLPTRPFGALVEPGTKLGPRPRPPRLRRARLHRRLARHRFRLRRRAAAGRALGDPVLRHLVAARPRAAGPGLHRRRADQRARRRRHDPPAQERHGPVDRAGVRARLGSGLPVAAARRPRGHRARSRSSTPTTSASCAAATCPR